MGYLLDVARNGHKPLNGAEWGSEAAAKEIEENLRTAKNEDMFDAHYWAANYAVSSFLEKNKDLILKAIEKGTKAAIDGLEEPAQESIEERARQRLRDKGYTDAHIATLEASAKLFDRV